MILNHKQAIEFLVDAAGETGFNRHTILNLHAALADNLLPDPQAAGRLRQGAVGIQGSVFYPLEGPQRIEAYFDLVLGSASAIEDPFEQAFFALIQLPYLQPFDDVNKRVSRLAANIPFIKANLAPLSFEDVSRDLYTEAVLGVYELRRIELLRDVFVWAYERSAARYAAIRQSLGEPDPFRMRHGTALRELVAVVVRGYMDTRQAAHANRSLDRSAYCRAGARALSRDGRARAPVAPRRQFCPLPRHAIRVRGVAGGVEDLRSGGALCRGNGAPPAGAYRTRYSSSRKKRLSCSSTARWHSAQKTTFFAPLPPVVPISLPFGMISV